MRPLARFAIASAVQSCAAVGPATAADGNVDTSFAFSHPGGLGDNNVEEVLSAPDGAAVTLVSFRHPSAYFSDRWRRITADGAVTTCVLADVTGQETFNAGAATFDRLGRLVVAGHDGDDRILVARFLYPACELDDSFDGNGIAAYLPGISAGYVGGAPPAAIVERKNISTFLTFHFLYVAFPIKETDDSYTHTGVFRIWDDGALDEDWNPPANYRRLVSPGRESFPQDMVLDPWGRLVIASYSWSEGAWETGACNLNECDYAYTAFRMNADGTLDDSFDGNGIKTWDIDLLEGGTDSPRGVAVAPTGHIAFAGYAESTLGRKLVIEVLDDAGQPVTGFDFDGRLVMSIEDGLSGYATDIEWQTDNRWLVVGVSGERSFAARFHATGALDSSFAGNGIKILPAAITPGGAHEAHAMALDGGRVLAAGGTRREDTIDRDSYVLRLQNDLIFRDGFVSGTIRMWTWSGPVTQP